MEWNYLGNELVVHMLQQHITRQETRQAYLFTGVPGVGRRTLALRFAQALNCTGTQIPGQACGKCKTCQRIGRMQYPDLSVVEAEVEGGTLKVEQIRQLQHTLSLTPYEARWRVALLLRFEEANANSQNALLKTLEEAPPSVILILVATYAENLLPTIVSRCEQMRLHPMPVDELARALENQLGWQPQEARSIAHLSQGRVGTAMLFKDSPESLQQYNRDVETLIQMLAEPQRIRFAYMTDLVKTMRADDDHDRRPIRNMLQAGLSLWRDVFIEASAAKIPIVNLDFQNDIARLALKVSPGTAREQITNAERVLTLFDSTNTNPQMLLDSWMLGYPRVN